MTSIKNQSFNRGETERIELNGFGTIVVRPVGLAVGIVFTGVVTITKRKDGRYSIYSPLCRGGNGRRWTGAPDSALVTMVGDDMPIEYVFDEGMALITR